MALCQICHKNTAVIFLTRMSGETQDSEGICLPCAYQRQIPGLDRMFSGAGIREDNINEIQERLNQVMEGMEGENPVDLFKRLVSGEVELDSGHFEHEVEEGTDSALKSENSAPKDNNQGMGELMPAHVGNDSEREGQNESQKSKQKRNRNLKYLNQFGTNLTELAEEGRIDRIIGRDRELDRVVQILNRRGKNNPALLGEPGVGKTAIAQGLAVRIAARQVPVKLLDRQIYQLDMTAMVAGTQFRGQFESRMKGVVDEAEKAGNIILVIDELHNIIGAGDAEGAMNAANILKPALAQGSISIIGCTTLDEYRRFIEKDSALERRFQKVIVDEPNEEDSLSILEGIRDYYEKHHHVSYSNETLATAVRLSKRYIHERYLPDKAIDLLDEAGSKVNLDNQLLAELRAKEALLQGLHEEREALTKNIESNRDEKKQLEYFEQDAELKSRELRISAELESLRERCKPVPITVEDIAAVVEMWTGIPVRRITEEEGDKLINLEERLHQRIIGQNRAVDALARSVRRQRVGFGKKRKPLSFLFVGPTGVGKTELVKALAEALFDTEDSLVRLDMSEYMEAHTVSKLIGSPPGYVGYDDAGQLTEKIRRQPYSVVLFDEIEKAHADVFNMLLQILDEGRLTDSHGRVINFENTAIIMTSNAGTSLKGHGIGFGATGHEALEDKIKTSLNEIFRPEFLNRIDDVVVFEELSASELRQIVQLMLREVITAMRLRGFEITIGEAAMDALVKEGYQPKFGARPLRKTIQRRIEDRLADLVLSGELQGKNGVAVDYCDNDYSFTVISQNES